MGFIAYLEWNNLWFLPGTATYIAYTCMGVYGPSLESTDSMIICKNAQLQMACIYPPDYTIDIKVAF